MVDYSSYTNEEQNLLCRIAAEEVLKEIKSTMKTLEDNMKGSDCKIRKLILSLKHEIYDEFVDEIKYMRDNNNKPN